MRGALCLLLVAVSIAGCGDDNSADPTNSVPVETAPAVAKPEKQVVVTETEYDLSPARAAGGAAGLVSIKVVNSGKLTHSLAVEGPNGLVELDGSVGPGQTSNLEVDLDKPGAYTWYCPLDGHRAKGMSGSIAVGGSSPARGAEGQSSTVPTSTGTNTTPTQTTTQTQTNTTTKTQTQTQTETVTTPSPTQTDTTPTATTGSSSDGY